MTYEYERDIPKFLKGIEYEHPLDLSKEIKEIQEIYRKAKAFDEIENNFPSSKSPEDFGEIVQQILIEHKERAVDER